MADDSSSSDEDQKTSQESCEDGVENEASIRSAPPLSKKNHLVRSRAVVHRRSSGKARKSGRGISSGKSGLHKGKGVSHAIKKPKPNELAKKSKKEEMPTKQKIKAMVTPAKKLIKQQKQKCAKTGTLSPSVNYTVFNEQILFTQKRTSPCKNARISAPYPSTPTTPASRGCASRSQHKKAKLFTPSRNYLEPGASSPSRSPKKKRSRLPSPVKIDKNDAEEDMNPEDKIQVVNSSIEALDEQEPTNKKAGTEDNYTVYVDNEESDQIAWNTVQELSMLENYSSESVPLVYEERSRASPQKLFLSSPRKSSPHKNTNLFEKTRLATVTHETPATHAKHPQRSLRKQQASVGTPVTRSALKSSESEILQEPNLFPIFGRNANTGLEVKRDPLSKEKSSGVKKNVAHTAGKAKDGLVQMVIDAGQKSIGSQPCQTCEFLYARGDATEEKIHSQQHKKYLGIISFSGWKNERVTDNDLTSSTRIVIVKPGDPKHHWEKAGAVLGVVDEALGVPYRDADAANSEMYLFIAEKRVVGCLLAEQLSDSHRVAKSYVCTKSKTRVLTPDLSDGELPIAKKKLVGVSRLWVHEDFQRTGVATRLVNAVLVFFRFPAPAAPKTELIFSHTTDAGAAFVEKYLQSSDYLVYKTD